MARSGSKLQRIWILTAIVVGLFACTLCQAQQQGKNVDSTDAVAKTRSEILKIEEIRNQAMLKHDLAALDHLCAADMAWTNQNGEVLTKSQMLDDLKTGKESFSTVAHDDVQMHIYKN